MCAFILTYIHIHVCDRQHTAYQCTRMYVYTYHSLSVIASIISQTEMRMSMHTSKERRGEYGIFLRLYSMGYKQAA